MLEEKKPIYDDRVNEILRGLAEGKNRGVLAKELNYKNYKTLDIYMRRKNFMWERDKQTYIPAYNRLDKRSVEVTMISSSKVATVISLFKKNDADARSIAKRLGFTDHRELATYMKAKGYVWSSDEENYIKTHGRLQEEDAEPSTSSVEAHTDTIRELSSVKPVDSPKLPKMDSDNLERFMPLLEVLERNRDRLIDLVIPGGESGKVPRYAVPGIFVTKSVHMTNTLDQLVREYSKEKNISQRDIFAVALIEFFRRYGYEREIETLLGRT